MPTWRTGHLHHGQKDSARFLWSRGGEERLDERQKTWWSVGPQGRETVRRLTWRLRGAPFLGGRPQDSHVRDLAATAGMSQERVRSHPGSRLTLNTWLKRAARPVSEGTNEEYLVSSSLLVPSSAGGMENGSRVRKWEEAGKTGERSNCPLLNGLSKVRTRAQCPSCQRPGHLHERG